MNIEPFDNGERLMAKAAPKKVAAQKTAEQKAVPKPEVRLTEAQRILAMPNPYLAAVARCVYRSKVDSEDHLADKKVFYFEDHSSLPFAVTYTAIEDGSR